MAQYVEADIPLEIAHGEVLTLGDGTELRWESNGEAKCVFVTGGFEPDKEIFPGNDWIFETGGSSYKLTARFEDALLVEKQ